VRKGAESHWFHTNSGSGQPAGYGLGKGRVEVAGLAEEVDVVDEEVGELPHSFGFWLGNGAKERHAAGAGGS